MSGPSDSKGVVVFFGFCGSVARENLWLFGPMGIRSDRDCQECQGGQGANYTGQVGLVGPCGDI